ncbi:hypothetical protein GGQ87_001290 [Brevundimonas alba]|uniref:Uncharacterized protein n=1 Tax=Brevundimonas alba TaxID=74314 RepID=A0A7X6BN37_9CAUL|nr:hypothetical protein [Brevundimonas alba]NJC41032.1 hypothetical protein [Brevundimonas alba]
MPKRTDLEVPGRQLNVSPRQHTITDHRGSFVADHGRTPRTTFDGLSDEKRQRLAAQIKVDERTLKELVDDAGTIVAVWLLARTGRDVYSKPQHQEFINASVEFLEQVHRLSRRGIDRPESEEGFAEARLTELALTPIRQELTPLMKLINPAWHDSTNWDVREALTMALTLSNKIPHGEDAAGDDRDRLAADCLTASWLRRTGRRPSTGTKRMSGPYRFYLALLDDRSPDDLSLPVEQPRSIIPQERSKFSRDEVRDFRKVVVEGGALRRAILRWLSDSEKRRKAG